MSRKKFCPVVQSICIIYIGEEILELLVKYTSEEGLFDVHVKIRYWLINKTQYILVSSN